MMRAALGTAGITLALASAMIGVVVFVAAARSRDRRFGRAGLSLVALVLVGAVVAFGGIDLCLGKPRRSAWN